jgi:hypothetical protein
MIFPMNVCFGSLAAVSRTGQKRPFVKRLTFAMTRTTLSA